MANSINFFEGATCSNRLNWIRDLFTFWQYECRKTQAESRARIHGKFARETAEIPEATSVHHLDEEVRENQLVKMPKGEVFLVFLLTPKTVGENKGWKQFSPIPFSPLSLHPNINIKTWNLFDTIDDFASCFRLMNCTMRRTCTPFWEDLLNTRHQSRGPDRYSAVLKSRAGNSLAVF